MLTGDNNAPSCNICLEVAFADGGNPETAKAINDAIEQRLFDMRGLSMQQAVDSFASRTRTTRRSVTGTNTTTPSTRRPRVDATMWWSMS